MANVVKSVSVAIGGQRLLLSLDGLRALEAALDAGADGFGMVDDDGVEAAETEAWSFIEAVKQAARAIEALDA